MELLLLSSNLVTSMIKEVGVQLSDMGFKRLILINAHGGQISLLNTAARELRSVAPNCRYSLAFYGKELMD